LQQFDNRGLRALRHEAEYYGIGPLIKRLLLIEEMDNSGCGDLLFYSMLPPPKIPLQEYAQAAAAIADQETSSRSTLRSELSRQPSDVPSTSSRHSRNSSWDMRVSQRNNAQHSRNPSLDLRHHSRASSADLNKFMKNDLGIVLSQLGQNWIDPLRVQIIKAHHNWIAVAYSHFFICYRMKDSTGWQLIFTSPFIEHTIERIAINSKANLTTSNENSPCRMVAVSYGSEIKLWGLTESGNKADVIGTFNLQIRVEYLFFIGNQLVALSSSGKIGVWHSNTRHFQIQDLLPILSFDYAGSFLLLGCNNGSIYYIGNKLKNFHC
jgi:hypothetical protein